MSPRPIEKRLDVDLETLSYSPVGAKRADPEDYWAETMSRQELPPGVVTRFENYVRRAVLDKQNEFEEVAFVDGNGKRFEKRMNDALKLRADKPDARRDLVQLLANDLSNEMAGSPNTLGGAIFLAQSKVDRKRAITIIKLDLNRQEVMALRSERRHAFEHKVFDRALPDGGRDLRKAIHYPSPGKGDARAVQYDSPSEYFRRFVGARPLREAKRATKAVVSVAKRLADEQGRHLTDHQVAEFVERVQKDVTSAEEAAHVLKEVARLDKRKAKIAAAIKKEAGDSSLSSFAPLKSLRYKFRAGLEWMIPIDVIRNKTVVVEEQDDDVVIRIKQAKIEFAEVFGNS